MKLRLRSFIQPAAAPLLSILFNAAQAVPPNEPTGERLRDLAQNITRMGDVSLQIGYASKIGFSTDGDDFYEAVAVREFSKLTCENDMKMAYLQPARGVFTFDEADKHVQFAEDNGMDVHGHALVWHNQNPAWLTDGTYDWTQESLLDVMKDHINETVTHYKEKYPGTVTVWDVVNEAFNDGDGSLRQSVWQQNIGTGSDYIKEAFLAANLADPDATLIINDYSVEDINTKSTAMYNLAVSLLSENVPIHGVGFQCHLTDGSSLSTLRQNMQRFDALGLEVYLTEVDVRISDNGNTNNLFTAQADVYRNAMEACLENSNCMAFQTWGITDKYSWIPGFFDRKGRAKCKSIPSKAQSKEPSHQEDGELTRFKSNRFL